MWVFVERANETASASRIALMILSSFKVDREGDRDPTTDQGWADKHGGHATGRTPGGIALRGIDVALKCDMSLGNTRHNGPKCQEERGEVFDSW